MFTHSLFFVNNKELILEEAIKLFAERGYFSTSTKLIATSANVSEALVFRHYWNKEWLLQAIFEKWTDEVRIYMDAILKIDDVRERVRAIIEFPVLMIQKNFHYWKLTFALKFQYPEFYEKLRPSDIEELVIGNLKKWLQEIWFDNVELEIANLIVFVEWVIQICIKKPEFDLEPLLEQWKSKY